MKGLTYCVAGSRRKGLIVLTCCEGVNVLYSRRKGLIVLTYCEGVNVLYSRRNGVNCVNLL